MNGGRLSVLDGMRGLAALLVLMRHTPTLWGGIDTANTHSYLAVDLFFLLSGFVISHAYATKLRDGRLSGVDFMRVRLIRLYPLYLLAAVFSFAICVPIYIARDSDSTLALSQAFLLSLAYLPALLPGNPNLFLFNAPSWSLFFEMWMNALYALVHRWLSDRLLWVTLVPAVLALLMLSIYNGGIDLGYTWSTRSLVGGTLRAFCGIFGGVLLHRYWQRRQPGSTWPFSVWLPVLASIGILAMPMFERGTWLLDMLAATLIFPICVYAGASAKPGPRTRRVFDSLGVASYPVYLLHAPMTLWLADDILEVAGGWWLLPGVLFAALCVGLGLVLDARYDQPLRNWLTGRGWSTRRAGN